MKRRLRLCDLPASERPRERLLQSGPSVLSDTELLAILLRSGNRGESVLQLAGRLLALGSDGAEHPLFYLRDASANELAAIPGIGPVRAIQIKAALELGRRLHGTRSGGPAVHQPEDAARHLMPLMQDLDREHFRVLLLNTRHQVLGTDLVAVGSLRECLVHPREVFKSAVRRSAHAVILAHNHPSGDPTPSAEDTALTRRLLAAGQLLGIEVLDHMILGAHRYVSLRQHIPEVFVFSAGA